jgi:MFS family permease
VTPDKVPPLSPDPVGGEPYGSGVDTSLQRRALAAIAAASLLVLTLWFSASAVAPQLESLWRLSSTRTAGLTQAVQIGFVVGALALAASGIPDAFGARRIFVVATGVAVAANTALVVLDGDQYWVALGLRFVTGAAIAGVYPAAMKVMSGWFHSGRGTALGVLVGALSVGSAGPHLIRGFGFEWRGVVLGASLLAALGGLIMAGAVRDGPFEVATRPFSWGHVGRIVRNRGVRLSTYGYLGHMWELYAMWTWTAAFLAASAADGGYDDGFVPAATFGIIAIGGLGSWVFGVWADRQGRTIATSASMAISGGCAGITPLLFGLSPWLVVPIFAVWGFAVVADSAQFSTMVTETASAEVRGTALTLQTAFGFLLTLITIQGVPVLADSWGWRWVFPLLALGPVFGIWAMLRLRGLPEAALLAGGKG